MSNPRSGDAVPANQGQTHQGPTYRGRTLPRPADELVDQGLGFDLVTVLDRRRALRAIGLSAAALGVAACTRSPTTGEPSAVTPSAVTSSAVTSSAVTSSPVAANAVTSTTGVSRALGTSAAAGADAEIPDETAGPYPGDGSNGPDALSESGILRRDIRSSFGGARGTAGGVPMELELRISNLADGGAPYSGVAVYVWHCSREGGYSMYSEGVADENFLRGVQIADTAGVVSFTSIFPACYTGRWPHIHFEVYPAAADITDASNAIATSQVALPESVCRKVYAQTGYEASVQNLSQVTLATDNVFGDDAGVKQLATVSGDVAKGYLVSLAVGVDTRTAPTGGSMGGSGGPGGAGLPGGSGGPGGVPPGG